MSPQCRTDTWNYRYKNIWGRDSNPVRRIAIDTSIPKNLTQCAFNFDDLNAQPVEEPLFKPIKLQAIPQKRCTGPCGQEYPATAEFFNRGKNYKGGLFHICKNCRRAYDKERRSKPEVKDRIRIQRKNYRNQPEVKEKERAYGQAYRKRPETQERRRDRSKRPEYLERVRIYRSQPHVKERLSIQRKHRYRQPSTQSWRKAYLARPEVRERRRAWGKADRERNREKYSAYGKKYRKSTEGQRVIQMWKERHYKRIDIIENRRTYRKEYHSRPEVKTRRREWHKATRKEYLNRPEVQERIQTYNNRPEVQERNRTRYTPEEKHARHRFHYTRNREKYFDRAREYRARKRGAEGTHTPAQIQELLKRQHRRCYYASCGHAKFERRNGKYIYHIEHIVPLSRGGSNSISNIVLACPTCNLKKHDKLPHEFPEGGRLL